jgi:hypothetical protein
MGIGIIGGGSMGGIPISKPPLSGARPQTQSGAGSPNTAPNGSRYQEVTAKPLMNDIRNLA